MQTMKLYYRRYADLCTEYSHTTAQLDVRTEELRKTRIDLENTQERYMHCNCSLFLELDNLSAGFEPLPKHN